MPDVSVAVIDRGRVRADMNFVVDGHASATASEPNPDHDYADFGVWNLVIETPEELVLWDTGPAPDAADRWPEPLYETFAYVDGPDHPLEADLEKAGFGIEEIDRVVMSHLHLDHAGNLDVFAGTEVPIHVHEAEIPFAYYSAVTDEGSIAYLESDFDHDLNWQVVHGDRVRLADGVELLHLPGHTPGMLGALIDTPGETGLVAGDLAYVAANYEQGRPMAQSLLWNNQVWQESRHRTRDIEARHGARVLYGHDLDQLRTVVDGWL